MAMTNSSFANNQIESLDRARALLESISQIVHALNQKGLRYNKRLDKILEILLNYFGVEQGSIMVLEKKQLVVATATRSELVGMKQPMDGDSIASWVATSREPIFIPDISKDKRFTGRGGKAYKKNSLLSVPIMQGGKLLGVINVTDKEGEKDLLQEDITYLLDFSSMIISTLVQQKLQKELHRQKNTLRKRNQELSRQEKLRDELYRMLIHDLKAPLAEVVANLDILSYSIAEENKEFLDAAQIGCDRTVRMVSNLVDINKIEDNKLTPFKEEVEPKLLIEESYSAIKGLARIRDVDLLIDVPDELPTIYLDRVLILRVLQNLLTNALGHATAGASITVGCSKVPKKNKLEFFVQDQGEGFSLEKQETVFEKYSRLSNKQDVLVGTGLGLYFCKLAIEVHRGKIGIDSSPGQGCRFFFTLKI